MHGEVKGTGITWWQRGWKGCERLVENCVQRQRGRIHKNSVNLVECVLYINNYDSLITYNLCAWITLWFVAAFGINQDTSGCTTASRNVQKQLFQCLYKPWIICLLMQSFLGKHLLYLFPSEFWAHKPLLVNNGRIWYLWGWIAQNMDFCVFALNLTLESTSTRAVTNKGHWSNIPACDFSENARK
jgi:hypothetical protein